MNNLVEQLIKLSKQKRELFASELRKQGMVEPIAIIGMACRFPGEVTDLDTYWQLLAGGRSGITEVPAERWDINSYFDENPLAAAKTNSRWGGFLKYIDKFDAGFFGIFTREAQRMDPQQRLLLEVAWEAMEDAGLVVERLAGSRTGIFVGIALSDYGRMQIEDLRLSDAYAGTGSAFSIAANRLSYCFDLRGPSIAVDTACSSSLVSVHLACQSLWNNESTLALAGGVNLILSPAVTINFSKTGFLSPDGQCKAFDAQANGYVRSEGVGIVVLKPLLKAIEDGDRIYAAIRGSAVNQDGKTNGLTAPNRQSQEDVLKAAYQKAGILPGLIQYVETHGTGTSLGDPIEVSALANVLAQGRPAGQPAAIGSVKTNLGHLEAAAGIASLIKVALMMKYRMLAPSLHFKEANPHIPFPDLPVKVQESLQPWPANGAQLAGVSSFGFGGTNAHVVLEGGAPGNITNNDSPRSAHGCYLLPISARSERALQSLAAKYKHCLESNASANLDDICYSASLRRSHHNFRLALAGRTAADQIAGIDAYLNGKTAPTLSNGIIAGKQRRQIVFLFPGQGSQWSGMARQLLMKDDVFAAVMKACDTEIARETGWSVIAALQAEEQTLNQIDKIQPALFAIEAALAAMWQAQGVQADVVVGHSMGEVAASYVAGALTLADAVKVICRRSRLLRRISGQGSMLAVELTMEEARQAITGDEEKISIAVSNSPTSTVLSGDRERLAALKQRLEDKGVYCRSVNVDVSSHSPQVDPLTTDLLAALSEISPQQGSVPIFSTVTGELSYGEDFNGRYWVKNLRQPVLFAHAIERLAKDNNAIFIEMSPHPILLPAVQNGLDHYGYQGSVIASLRRDCDEELMMKTALGQLYCSGYELEWQRQYPQAGRYTTLPAYAWQHESYWLPELGEAARESRASTDGNSGDQLLTSYFNSSSHSQLHFWNCPLKREKFPYLEDHRVLGSVIFPAAGYLEMAMSATRQIFSGQCSLEDIEFEKALLLSRHETRNLQLVMEVEAAEQATFSFASQPADASARSGWTVHARGTIRAAMAGPQPTDSNIDLVQLQSAAILDYEGEQLYRSLSELGLQYGPCFQGVAHIWQGKKAALGLLKPLTELLPATGNYVIHPCLLDACLQVLSAALERVPTRDNLTRAYLPVAMKQINFHNIGHGDLWAYASVKDSDSVDTVEGDLTLLDESGRTLIEITGLRLARIDNIAQFIDSQQLANCFYQVEWQASKSAELTPSSADADSAWLVLGGNPPLANRLCARLASQGDKVLNLSYQINKVKREDFERVFNDTFSPRGPRCRGIVLLPDEELLTPAANLTTPLLEQTINRLSAALLNLVQAIASTDWQQAPRLWFVTAGAQLLENESITLTQSPLSAISRAIAYEFPEFNATSIDLSPLSPNTSLDEAELTALARELITNSADDRIALRGTRRFVARLTKGEPAARRSAAPHFNADASYLITGGLSGLGLATAKWMAANGARHLALVSRRTPDADACEILTDLRARDVNVLCVSADIAEHNQVVALMERISDQLPPLKGIVHAAGILDDGTLLQLDQERFNAVVRPKAVGAWNLHALSLDRELDFFLLYSSAASLLGAPGQGNYVVANAFLDALAHYRQSLGLPALAINWAPWAEIGMATEVQRGARLSSQGIGSISTAQGLAALELLIREEKRAQAGCLTIDFRQWQRCYPMVARLPFFGNLAPVEPEISERKPATLIAELLGLANDQQRLTRLVRFVKEELAQVLRISPHNLPIDQPLQTLGLDSLMAIELRNRLEHSLALKISAATIWNYPTVTALCQHLGAKLNFTAASEPGGPQAQETPPPSEVERLKSLSEAEAEALLLSELDKY